MKSPFPGLDPYLQEFWSNVHTSMMTYIRDQLQQQLPPGLWTRVEESVAIDDPADEKPRTVFPDVHVTEEGSARPAWKAEVEGGVAVAEPLVIPAEPRTQRHIEIVDTHSGAKVVTVIEVLSPSNKEGPGRESYWHKQRDYIHGEVNLVEMDLLRPGGHIVAVPFGNLPRTHQRGCIISVYRTHPRTEFEVYPVSLRKRLPCFCVPLRATDKDVALDLQAVLDQCYANGRYDIGIDYAQPPEPPLAEADRQWAAALIEARTSNP